MYFDNRYVRRSSDWYSVETFDAQQNNWVYLQ